MTGALTQAQARGHVCRCRRVGRGHCLSCPPQPLSCVGGLAPSPDPRLPQTLECWFSPLPPSPSSWSGVSGTCGRGCEARRHRAADPLTWRTGQPGEPDGMWKSFFSEVVFRGGMKCPHAFNQFCLLSVFCSYKQSSVNSLYIHIFCSCLSFSVRSISGSLLFAHGRGGPASLRGCISGPPALRFHGISLPPSTFPFSLSCHLCFRLLGLAPVSSSCC